MLIARGTRDRVDSMMVARTIADLAQADAIDVRHVGETLALRVLDRKMSG